MKKRSRRLWREAAKRARERAVRRQSGYRQTAYTVPEGARLFRPREGGVKRIDVIPFVAGKGNPYAEEGAITFERTFWVHRNVGPDQAQYVCPAKSAGKRCPICEYRRKLMDDPAADEQMIKDLKPQERQLFNVIDVDEPDKGIQIWDVSYWCFGKQLDGEIKTQAEDPEAEEDYSMFFSLTDGYTLRVAIEEASAGSFSYFKTATIQFRKRRKPYPEDLLDEAHCLDDLIIVLPYEKLKAIFLQLPEAETEVENPVGEDDEAPFEVDEADAVADEPVDEDEEADEVVADDEPEGEEDEAEVPPKGRSAAAKSFARTSGGGSSKSRSKKPSSEKGPKCPAGGRFGVDTDTLKECADCELWDECDDAKYGAGK